MEHTHTTAYDKDCQVCNPFRLDASTIKVSNDRVAALERDLAAACVRAEAAERDAKNFEEALDNVRAALGLESTHWMVVHDDVKKVVDELAGLREVADAAILWLAWYKAEPKTSAQGPLLKRLEAAVAALRGKKE